MNYTIHSISHHISAFDDDAIDFKYVIHFTEPEEMQVNYHYDLSMLLNFIRDKHPAFYEYYKTTKTSIDTWGPAERQTLDAMGDEAVEQIYRHLEEYLLTCDWMGRLYEQQQQIKKMSADQHIKHAEGAAKVVKTLSHQINPIKNETMRSRMFCNAVDKKLREIAVEIYPEITNLDPEQLKEFRYFFTNDIMSMTTKLDKLIYVQKKAS
jgi:hypothetical protein